MSPYEEVEASSGGRRLAVALSGGGYRAAAFNLGAMLYLADAGWLGHIANIASVSGGSITNAWIGSAKALKGDGESFWAEMRPLAHKLRGSTLFFSGPAVFHMLITVALMVLAGYVWFTPWNRWGLAFIGCLMALLVWFRLRGWFARLALDRVFFAGLPLSELDTDGVDHILCATHLNAGEFIYFSGAWVYSWRLGWAGREDYRTRLSTAVMASAAFPGAFPPVVLPARPFGFAEEHPTDGRAQRDRTPIRWLHLVDGGVYDNMADQWAHRYLVTGASYVDRREIPSAMKEKVQGPADALIAVNASRELPWKRSLWRMVWPGIGEIAAIWRDKSIMYDNSAERRMVDLSERFRAGLIDGTVVRIDDSPIWVAENAILERDKQKLQRRPDEIDKARVKDLLETLCGAPLPFDLDPAGLDRLRCDAPTPELKEAREKWRSRVESTRSIGTNLWALGQTQLVNLLLHGYLLTLTSCHLFLDGEVGRFPITVGSTAQLKSRLENWLNPERWPGTTG